MKKLLAILLAALMLLSLAACGAPADDTNTPAGETAQADESEYHGELPFVKEGDEPITITIALVNNADVADYENNAYTKWLEEQTGLNLEFILFPDQTTVATQVALMIAAGEKLPDILFRVGGISKQQGESYGQEGYFYPLSECFDKYGYYFKKSFGEAFDGDYGPMNLLLRWCEGADHQPIFCFPFVLRDQWSDPMLQGWINQDWLDKLGLEIPETVGELYNVLVAFRDGDPNGNGKKDEIPMTGITGSTYAAYEPLNWILNAYIYFDHHVHFNVNNRVISSPYNTDEYREALKFLNKLYKEGLITQIIWTQTKSELKGLANPAEGEPYLAGIIFYNAGLFNRGGDSMRAYTPLKPLKDASGKGGYAANYYSRVMTTYISADCEHPIEAFKLLDYMCSSDSYLRQRYGEYGVDWEWAEPGKTGNRGGEAKIKTLHTNSGSSQSAQTWEVIASVASELDWQYEVDFTDPDNCDTMRVLKYNQLYENSMNAPVPDEVFDFAIYSTSDYEERSEFAKDLTEYVYERRGRFITGEMDPNSDADWQNYLDGLQALHYDRWIELAQIGYDRLFE